MRRSEVGSRVGRLLVLLVLVVGRLLLGPPSAWAGAAGWVLPLAGPPQVARGFDPPASPYGAGHRGVDLRATTGAAVSAAGAGRVSYAGLLAGRGVVVVVHGDLRTTYEPVVAAVHVGQPVVAGQLLGRLAGGHCAPSCLHWGLLRGTIYLNPLLLVGPVRVRLLPIGASGTVAGPGGGAAGRAGLAAVESAGSGVAGSGVAAPVPTREPRLALRASDRPLGVGAVVALLLGLGLLVRRPPPDGPTPAGPTTSALGAPHEGLSDPPLTTVDLGSERARRRAG